MDKIREFLGNSLPEGVVKGFVTLRPLVDAEFLPNRMHIQLSQVNLDNQTFRPVGCIHWYTVDAFARRS